MRAFLASSTVFLTILLSFAFGIAFGYVVIIGILRAFTRRPEASKPAPAGQAAIPAPAPGH
jgi:hypothetical protein